MSTHLNLSSELLKKISLYILTIFVFLYPVFFLPFTLDFLEINKQTLLLLFIFLVMLVWIGSVLLRKSIYVRIGWPHIFLILPLVAWIISAWNSHYPYMSWIGTTGSEYTSVLSLLGLLFLFYTLVNVDEDKICQNLFIFSLLGAMLAGLFGIFSFLGVFSKQFLFISFPTMFNTVGTTTSLSVFLIIFCVFVFALAFGQNKTFFIFKKKWQKICGWVCLILLPIETLVVLIAIDAIPFWLLFIFGLVLLLFFFSRKSFGTFSFQRYVWPILLIVISVLYIFWFANPLGINTPTEVTLNTTASIEIVKKILQEKSFTYFGTGPGTYLFNYSALHSTAINQTDFWNIRFDRSSSFFLTLLPTVGLVGTSVYLLFILILFIVCIIRLFLRSKKKEQDQLILLFCPWILIVLGSFLFAFNMTLIIVLFFFSGLLASHLTFYERQITFSRSKIITFLFYILFLIIAFSLFVGIFLTTQRYVADSAYAKGIRADRDHQDIKIIIEVLDKAATTNRFRDDYYRALAQALLVNVSSELHSSKNIQLSETTKTYLQSLIATAVNAAVHATEVSPFNVTNWLVRGEIYRSLIGLVPHASEFANNSYEKAIKLEPMNPSHWNEWGKKYILDAEVAQSLIVSSDQKISAQAKKDKINAFTEAQKAFNKSIELKSNFAPAHFQLALLFEKEGKFDEAIGKLESLGTYNSSDVGVAYELGLAYLKRGTGDDFNRAKNALQHVVTLSPSHSNAHWYLSYIFENQKDHTKAIQEMEIVLKLNPDNTLVKTRLDKLKSGGWLEKNISPPENIKNE